MARDLVCMNAQLEEEKPNICPVCGEKHPKLIKKGVAGKKQRYLHVSNSCNRKFVYDSNTITSWMKIGKDEFLEICMDTLGLVPKCVSMNLLSQRRINYVSNMVNNYPRKPLGYKSPYELSVVLLNEKVLSLNNLSLHNQVDLTPIIS